MSTAAVQSHLWGMRAKDWAEVQEGMFAPLYEAVLNRGTIGAGAALLDIGCGSGLFCQQAAHRGARISGLDATTPLLEIARERVPHGDFRAGEMEALPYADRTFDLITGFNAFQYAADPASALREARRVARPEAAVVIGIWGKRDECEAAAYVAALGALLPPLPPGAPGPFALSVDGALEGLAAQAGLTATHMSDVACVWDYPDEDTALRGLLSAGPARRAIQHAGEAAVSGTVLKSIAPFKTAAGGYRLRNTARYLIAAIG